MPARSEPAAGSDIAIEPIVSPELNLGSQRSSVVRVVSRCMYGMRMSFCTPRPMPTDPVMNISSEMIWLNRKSLDAKAAVAFVELPADQPVLARGQPRLAADLAFAFPLFDVRLRTRARSNARAVARKSSCTSSIMLRRIRFLVSHPR